MVNAPSFATYYAGDAYSTANKIMGRQSAGNAFMRGVARTWPSASLHGLGQGTASAKDFAFSRNSHNPAAFSFMGMTFTLSSNGAVDQVAELILPPSLLGAAGVATAVGVRCLMWLWKFDLVKVEVR